VKAMSTSSGTSSPVVDCHDHIIDSAFAPDGRVRL